MRITDVINHKGSSVVTADPDQDLAHLVRLLTEHNIGAVVIAGPDGSVAGIAGERDVVRALAAYGPEALSHPISDIMAAEVRAVATADTPVVISADGKVPYESVMQVMDLLRNGGIGKLGLLVNQNAPATR